MTKDGRCVWLLLIFIWAVEIHLGELDKLWPVFANLYHRQFKPVSAVFQFYHRGITIC